MTRAQIMTKYNCSLQDACTIENIVTVKEWNETRPNNQIKFKTGFVMPVYHGHEWNAKKINLIRKYAYIGI